MKIRGLANKMLWFVLGVVVAGLLTIVAPSHSESTQDYWQEISSLQTRVAALEKYNKDREKAAAKEIERNRDKRSEGPPDLRDRDRP